MVRRVQAAPPAATVVAIALSLLILLAEVTVVETLRFRAIVLGLGLALSFLTLRVKNRFAGLVPHGLALMALGITMTIARPISLLPSMKPPGGPHTLLPPPLRIVNNPPLKP